MTRLTAAQREAADALERGEACPPDRWVAWLARHEAERTPPLPPDAPRDDFPLRHLEAVYIPPL